MNNYAQDIRPFRGLLEHEYEKAVSCWAPFQALHIDKKGYCGPCPFSFKIETPWKMQWSETNSLLDIWKCNILETLRSKYFGKPWTLG